MPDANGTAVAIKYCSLSEVEEHICSLSSELNTSLFEVVPVRFKQAYNAKRHMRQKRLEETECEKQTRLANARKYKKRQRDKETEIEKMSRLAYARNLTKKAEKSCAENETYTRLTNVERIPLSQNDYLKK